MTGALGLELPGGDLFPHAVEQRQGDMFAAASHQFGEGSRKRRLGDDLWLDPGRQALGPGLAVAFGGGHPHFFPDKCVYVPKAVLHGHVHPVCGAAAGA